MTEVPDLAWDAGVVSRSNGRWNECDCSYRSVWRRVGFTEKEMKMHISLLVAAEGGEEMGSDSRLQSCVCCLVCKQMGSC